jgi:hypothetical protein
MNPLHVDRLLASGFHAFDRNLLRASSLLVPAAQRPEWLREWHAELWHVRHECLHECRNECLSGCGFSWEAEREVTAFCLGSFSDALCLRRHFHVSGASPAVHGSAAQCVLWLATLLAICAVLARLLPGVQSELESARYQVRPGLLLIQDARSADSSIPTITPAQFRDWRSTRQRSFDGFAFYRIGRDTAFLPAAKPASWTVAYATPNLFPLLGLPAPPAAPAANDLPAIFLSHRAWARDYRSDSRIAGRIVRLAHTTARVAGVIPGGPWHLPGDPDAWIIEASAQFAAGSSTAPGYLIAHLTPFGQAEMAGQSVPITVQGPNDNDLDLAGVSFSPQSDNPWSTFEFALFLALLALPAVISVTLSESNFSSHRPRFKRRLARWLFLAAKLGLISAIGCFASLDLAYVGTDPWSPWAPFVQLVASFVICLFGLRWAVADQQQRCPVCLRRVTHPARVGLASCTFLGWNGTEMICLGGHTLLHVPSLPTSWFGAPRWTYLDHSWDFLFANNPAA